MSKRIRVAAHTVQQKLEIHHSVVILTALSKVWGVGTNAWGIFAESGVSSRSMMILALKEDHQQSYFL